MTNQSPRRIAAAALILPVLAAPPASGQTLNEDRKLIASNPTGGALFGSSVAVSGTTAIVGAPFFGNTGAVYLFDTTTGQEIDGLVDFGPDSTVAISGTTAIVGSPGYYFAAYLIDTTTGVPFGQLTASDGAPADEFGSSVAISGTTAIVGAPFDNGSGSAYLFDTTTGTQIAKLTASDGAPDDEFGSSVAISGTTAIVGAHRNDDAGSNSGSAYLFDFSDPNNIIETKLTASDAAPDDWFGSSVAISSTAAIVGAPFDDDAGTLSGSAYLFDFSDPNNIVETKLTASDAAPDDRYGFSVAISGTTAIVGAYRDDDAGSNSGSAYLFDTTTGTQIAKLTASDAAPADQFGSSVAISGTTAIVGAPRNGGSFTGAAYVFDSSSEIVLQPEGDIVNVGDAVSFEVDVADTTNINFQWRRDGANLADGGNISGATTRTLSIIASESDEAFYDCLVSGMWGPPSLSEQAILAVRPDPNACYPDANGDGVLDFFDLSQFIIEFGRGCP